MSLDISPREPPANSWYRKKHQSQYCDTKKEPAQDLSNEKIEEKKKWGNEEKNHKLGKEDYEKKNIYIHIYGHERDRNDYWRLWHKFQKKAKQNLK